jgi:hypothetical protein
LIFVLWENFHRVACLDYTHRVVSANVVQVMVPIVLLEQMLRSYCGFYKVRHGQVPHFIGSGMTSVHGFSKYPTTTLVLFFHNCHMTKKISLFLDLGKFTSCGEAKPNLADESNKRKEESERDLFLGGGTNLSDKGLNLRGSWQQGHSAPYNTPSRI